MELRVPPLLFSEVRRSAGPPGDPGGEPGSPPTGPPLPPPPEPPLPPPPEPPLAGVGEGWSPGPAKEGRFRTLGAYLDALDRNGSAINFALLVGSSNPREMVIGNVNRPPTADEMREMDQIVDQAMRDGAIGLSTSLIYLPAMFSTTDEIVSLARVAAKYDGVYFTHMRDEGEHIDQGLDETFRIGREAHIPVNIWHLKVGGPANWGKMPHVIARIDEARVEGIDAAANVYPYIASSTGLSTLIPDWALEGGYAAMQDRLKDS